MSVNLMLGDCLERMKEIPDGSVNMILTDPPYKITARGNSGNSGVCFRKKEVNNGKVFKDWLPEFYRILKNDSHCLLICQEHP